MLKLPPLCRIHFADVFCFFLKKETTMRRPEIRKVHPVLLFLCFTFQRVPGKTCVCDVSKATGAYCVQIDKNNQND